ncbi:MAG: hypothetical protein NWE76_03365 [Candidatus Bathyarchaeota archaeon]|nr:hypothetical protein [Candidatus Bathyarchaeota archaeon]
METAEQQSTLAEHGFYTKEELYEIFEPTESLEERLFELTSNTVKFSFDEDGESPPKVFLAGDPFYLTDEAYLNACRIIGLGSGYSERTPISLVIPHLNYWFSNLGGQKKAVIRDRKVVAFMRPGTEIYSNVKIIDSVLETLKGLGVEDVMFDKVYHDLYETQVSLVIGESKTTNKTSTGQTIHGGIQIQNSVLGYKPLIMSGYLNSSVGGINGGMISVTTAAQWDRRLGTTPEEVAEFISKDLEFDEADIYSVYDWTKESARDIFFRIGREFKAVDGLVDIGVGSHAGTFFSDVFKKYKIPSTLRKAIQEEYADRDGGSVYDLWESVVAVAGRPEVRGNPNSMRHMMIVGGELAAHPSRCPSCHRLEEAE